jgi:NTP pyrophosphatase (non-canonical NTP hydrolase)
MMLADIVREAHATAQAKGFWDERGQLPDRFAAVICLALVTEEVGEAVDACRNLKDGPHDPDTWRQLLTEELADIIIRIADLAGYLHLPLEPVTIGKMVINKDRPRLHGKAF